MKLSFSFFSGAAYQVNKRKKRKVKLVFLTVSVIVIVIVIKTSEKMKGITRFLIKLSSITPRFRRKLVPAEANEWFVSISTL